MSPPCLVYPKVGVLQHGLGKNFPASISFPVRLHGVQGLWNLPSQRFQDFPIEIIGTSSVPGTSGWSDTQPLRLLGLQWINMLEVANDMVRGWAANIFLYFKFCGCKVPIMVILSNISGSVISEAGNLNSFTHIAIENGSVEIVSFPISTMDLSI